MLSKMFVYRLCCQAPKQSISLETRKQNYIIIFTSLLVRLLRIVLNNDFFKPYIKLYTFLLVTIINNNVHNSVHTTVLHNIIQQSIPFTQTVNTIYIPSHLSKLTKNISTSLYKLTILYHIYHTTIYSVYLQKTVQIPQQIVQPKIHFNRYTSIISLPHQKPRITHLWAF